MNRLKYMRRATWGELVQKIKSRYVLRESVLMATICLLDLASTILVVSLGIAVESNPLLKPAMEAGPLPFALLKMATFLVPIAVLEFLLPTAPTFIRTALRLGIIGYLAVYIFGSIVLLPK